MTRSTWRSKSVDKNLDRAFKLIRRVVEHPERFPDRFIAIPLDPKTVTHLFTKERIRMLRVLRDDGPFPSVGELAEELRRDETRVSRDLMELVDAGLAHVERRGKTKIVSAAKRTIVLA